MKKVLVNYGGIILFYLILIIGMFIICSSKMITRINYSSNNSVCVN